MSESFSPSGQCDYTCTFRARRLLCRIASVSTNRGGPTLDPPTLVLPAATEPSLPGRRSQVWVTDPHSEVQQEFPCHLAFAVCSFMNSMTLFCLLVSESTQGRFRSPRPRLQGHSLIDCQMSMKWTLLEDNFNIPQLKEVQETRITIATLSLPSSIHYISFICPRFIFISLSKIL